MGELSADMRMKLADMGLLVGRFRSMPTLGEWCDEFLGRCASLKPNTLAGYEQGVKYLKQWFDQDTPLDHVTPDDAAAFRAWLYKRGDEEASAFSEATVRTHCRAAKVVFGAAVDAELLLRNPFRKLAAASLASKDRRYVTIAETEAVLKAAPDVHWRLLVDLARFAGLRVPSESHLLT